MKSLRGRLLLATMLVLVGMWMLWSCLHIASMTSEHTGWWDKSIRDTTHQIITSLPENIDLLSADSRRLQLPANEQAGHDDLSFQIWSSDGTSLLRSLESPSVPLRSNFKNGFSIEEVDGRKWRVYSVQDASGKVYVQTGIPWEAFRMDLKHWVKSAFFAALMVFIILALTLKAVVRWSLKPVTSLQSDIAEREEFDLTPLSTKKLPQELKPLIESFNRLLLRIDTAINNERQFIADAAHELRTPMAAIQTHAQVAAGSTTPEETRAALARLITAVERGTRLTQQLLDSARLESNYGVKHERVDLVRVITLVADEFDIVAQQRQQAITIDAQPCSVCGDVDELGILLRNLLDNALRYSGEGSRIELMCGIAPSTDGITLCVKDNGPGVPDPEQRARIFERFYRADQDHRRGSGIGLSLVRRIAHSHGAELEVTEGLDNRGLCISVHFPVLKSETL
ncbi:MAG TPA: ATP-binding protein [Cellvibrio sp.]|nr:ATP-binding protein [Cellvibrio sp.]